MAPSFLRVNGRSIQRQETKMSNSYRAYDPDQPLWLPSVLQEWLPSAHLAYFLPDIRDRLDMSAI